MAKRKNSANANGGRGESLVWSPAMDEVLINAFVHQNDLGNRVGGTFTTQAYDNILKELKEIFPDKPIDKEKVKNRMKYIKKGFGTCYDIFRKSTSGFQWSPITNMWIAEPEVWEKLIEAHPEAADWMNKPIYHYDKLLKLYGQDRANGDTSETAAEMRRRLAQEMNEIEGDTIATIDRMVAQNEATLEGHDGENINSPEAAKRQKKMTAKEEAQAEIMKGIQGVANAILSSTEQLVKAQSLTTELLVKAHTSKLSMPASEIWNHVNGLALDPQKVNLAYRFLIQNPNMLEAMLGCPLEERKKFLMDLI